ncbi:putative nucleotide-binding alpha-beta plait domain, NTF2-like domain-containing protein [Rosa chinensis]|uniref:Putative nucleotide-binding alpha-beta plait domain, NTF2-like domain-containing protein n=1 Tax=Rosa chinensis TaxID=74649 RepID=A0A2P6PU52_ROSCH|nr:nuclear transport factor 2 isoform X1 [Rosa chinensis]PRQ25462.1 putative nucleotide-binding alpha-beta plait domain, NTF2-like domain-containing protein [Rosa chinensis]
MASPAVQQQVAPTADVVGNAFVLQYYHILEQSPEHVYRFYQDDSKFGRPEDNGMMKTVTTMDIINRKIVENGKLSANVVTVDAQESFNRGVFVLVTGFIIGKDNLRKKFTQSFFLAPQEKGGFYVLNDVFRYVDDSIHQNTDHGSVADVEPPLTSEHDPSFPDSRVSEPVTAVSEDVTEEEVYNPLENGEVPIEVEEIPVPEVVDEIPDDSEVVTESGYSAPVVAMVESEKPASVVDDAKYSATVVAEAGHSAPVVAESVHSAPVVVGSSPKSEEVPKKSYASIVKVMKESALPFSTPAHAAVRAIPKPQEQRVIAAPQPASVSETVVSSTNAKEDGNQPEAEVEGHSIYIKGLPFNATPALIENEFKKFGPIKNGGVQVRTQKGFGFGFVEFEDASAVQSALEASPIMINGRQVVVEEKRSTSRGGNRGRFSTGRGSGYRNEGSNGYRNEGANGYRNDGPNAGYRNDAPNGYRSEGPRGRGGYGGGRGYGRSEFKSEFGGRNTGRGGSSGRGGDGYQRSDNGGRVNRAGGQTVNATAKSSAPRVSASA